MRFEVLATDYDGTLARHGKVDDTTVRAVEWVRSSGRRLFMVTGREVDDLKRVFARLDLFDIVVAENGAVLYWPSTGEFELLHQAPPTSFAAELKARKVAPLSIGKVIVATVEPNEHIVLQVIKQLGLELEIIFNKGSVMVLPTGVNKGTGLSAALKRAGTQAERTVGIGDAENDHAFLKLCGCGAAVSNAIPSLKQTADWTTHHSHGAGVTELARRLVDSDLQGLPFHRRHCSAEERQAA